MAQLGTVHTRDGGFEKALGVDAGSTTMARTFRYTKAEEAGRILTDAEVTVVLQAPLFQAWKNFVDHGDFLGAQGEIDTATDWGKLLLRAKIC